MYNRIIIAFVFLIHIIWAENINRDQWKLIESHMNTSADPCVDFFEYACGNYGNIHNYNKGIVSTINDNIVAQYTKILNNLKNSTLSSKYNFVGNVLNYYNSCQRVRRFDPIIFLNWIQAHENISWPYFLPPTEDASSEEKETQSSEQNESKSLFQLTRLNTSKNGNFNWIHTLAVLCKYGMNNAFIDMTVSQNNARNYGILIEKSSELNIIQKEFLSSVTDYFDDPDLNEVERLEKEYIKFEQKLESLNSTAIRSELTTKTMWLKQYFSIVFGEIFDTDIEVSIEHLPYVEGLVDVLNDYDDEFICRYLMIRYIIYVVDKWVKSATCLSNTLGMLPLGMDWLYDEYNPHLMADQEIIEEMFSALLKTFKGFLNKNPNKLSDEVLTKLHDKADGMILKLGNLPRPSTTEKLETFYKNLNLTADNYFENYLLICSFQRQAIYKRLKDTIQRDDTFFDINEIGDYVLATEYYIPTTNMVFVPLPVLTPPLYHPHYHDVYKYSTLGVNMGHEISHAFDKNDVSLDEEGNESDILNSIGKNERYSMYVNCLDWKNPNQTGEKTGDLNGIILAFETLFDEKQMAELHWTSISPQRLFFLNYAQIFCSSLPDYYFSGNEHPTDHSRIVEALKNFEQFSRAYDCPLGTPMNPDKKCQIWHNT